MTPAEIYKLVEPSAAHLTFLDNGNRVSSGSGFIARGKLITAGHLVNCPNRWNLSVHLAKGLPDISNRWFPGDLGRPYLGFSDEHSYDYAIIDVPADLEVGSLEFGETRPEPGEEVFALGFPFENPELTIHQGIVSAVFKSGVATILKLDMSINPSNSGGPLIRKFDGKVVGVVTRKATGLTNAFDKLLEAMEINVKLLSRGRTNSVFISGFDYIAMAQSVQNQMQTVALEMQRSANVGIGYAVWIDQLLQEPALQASDAALRT